jgi:hypothetical protein
MNAMIRQSNMLGVLLSATLSTVAFGQVTVVASTPVIPLGESYLSLRLLLDEDFDATGIGGILMRFTPPPGVEIESFLWREEFADAARYYASSDGSIAQTAYWGTAGFGEIISPGAELHVGTLHLFTSNTGTIQINLDIEVANDETFEAFMIQGDPLALTVENMIIGSTPPNGAIDARQPSEPDGSAPAGWSTVTLQFISDAPSDEAAHYVVESDPPGAAPGIASVAVDGASAVVTLDSPIPTGAWTIVRHIDGATTTRLGWLPGDTNADALSSPLDLLRLIDALNGLTTLEPWSGDINRSGQLEPADILRSLDLLNGAGVYSPWYGRSLP